MTAEAATDEQRNMKRPRIDPAAGALAANGPTATAETHGSREQAAQMFSVPAVGEHINTSTLVPALQQLLAAYQVEYWAALEQLRCKHNAAGQQVTGPGAAAPEAAAAATESRAGSFDCARSLRQLWEASHNTADGAPPRAQQPAAAASSAPDHQHQRQQQHKLYGDERCGYAPAHTNTSQQHQQHLQQQEQLQQQPPQHAGPRELPSLREVEQLLQLLPVRGRDVGAASAEQQAAWQRRFQASAAAIAGLEQLASAATLQFMDAQGALACLCGQQGRWLVRRSAVTLGRSTDSKGEVDIDLSKAAPAVGEPPAPAAAGEPSASAPPAAGDTAAPAPAAAAADGVNAPPAPPTAAASTAAEQPAAMSDAGGVAAAGAGGGATAAGAPPTEQGPPGGGQAGTSWSGGSSGLKQVSRLQAQLLLTSAGTWSLTNTGRASLAVNGRQVARGDTVEVPHLSLVEVAGLPLLFMVNSLAVQRAVARSAQVAM